MQELKSKFAVQNIPKHIESLGVTVEPNLRKALEWCDVANMLRAK
jgi:aspartate carbamoyltransferase catalytic subunit